MARDFVDDVDAGHKLAAVVMDPFDCIVAVLPTSRRIGEVVASTLQLPLASVTRILRPDDPVRPVEIEITDLQAPTHARLLVVDDAVETGIAERQGQAGLQIVLHHLDPGDPVQV